MTKVHQLFDENLIRQGFSKIDLSSHNPRSAHIDLESYQSFEKFVAREIEESGTPYGYGGYLEKRGWYARNSSFTERGRERIMHLGIDFWVPADTKIYAPYDGEIHSFKDNAATGDYGPTIIIKHLLSNSASVHMLYGHLSRESLMNVQVGDKIMAGAIVGTVGVPEVNGLWPPHLHLQMIFHMGELIGDYPGVTSEKELAEMKQNCPDPFSFIPKLSIVS